MQATVYNQEGKAVGDVTLPDAIFALPWNGDLMHQVMTALQHNRRRPVAHTKTRNEVRGGGKKPWRQKGTGRARHGSIRSPLWRTGGVTFGPRADRVFGRTINKKMATKAFFVALSQKLRDGEVIFVDALETGGKTQTAQKSIAVLLGQIEKEKSLRSRNLFCIFTPEHNEQLVRSFNNIGNVSVKELRNANTCDLLDHPFVIIVNPEESIAALLERMERRGMKASA